jgi:hypothetical protein
MLVLTVAVWGTAQVRKARLLTIKSLIQLTLLILFFSWSGTRLRLHMSDLLFSIIMLATFSSTFIFNRMYVRWQKEGAEREDQTSKSNGPQPVGNNDKKS